LLAEGLYALITREHAGVPFAKQLAVAAAAYWFRFIEARRDVIIETTASLRRHLDWDPNNRNLRSALVSLTAAENQLITIKPDLCVNFLDAWRDDLNDWQRFSTAVNNVGSTREAMDFLQLQTWTRAEFGVGAANSTARPAGLMVGISTLISNLSRCSNRPNARRNWRSPVGTKPSAL
jgi:hypothetical protein